MAPKSRGVSLSDFYHPHPPQKMFMECGATYKMFGGAKGPGKSFALMWEAVACCLRVPGCNVLVLRRTYPELRKGLIRHFELYVPPQLYGGVRNWNKSENVVTFPNGSKLFFGCAQHEKDILAFNGHEYYAIFIDESTEFTFFQFQFLAAQNRCPIKKDRFGNDVKPFMAMGTNPIGVGHDWHKALFIGEKQPDGMYRRDLATVRKILPEVDKFDPKDYAFVPALLSDNPIYANDEAYIAKLEKLPEQLKEAYLRGNWETFAGRYFRFDPNEVVIDKHLCARLIEAQPWHKRWIGIDWGYNDFCAVYWFTTVTLKDEEGNGRDVTVVYRELVVQGVGEADLGEQIAEMSREKIDAVYMSPDAWHKKGSANTVAEQVGDVLVDCGVPYPSPADDDRVGGARLMDEMLGRRLKTGDGEFEFVPMPDLMISEECEKLLHALPRLMKDDKNPNDVQKLKREGDPADDCYDACRYGLKSKLAGGDVPYSVLRQRILDSQPDNQSRYLTDISLKMTNKRGGGLRFGRPRGFRAGGAQ
jgi:phage terminase large subunit